MLRIAVEAIVLLVAVAGVIVGGQSFLSALRRREQRLRLEEEWDREAAVKFHREKLP